MPDFSYDPVNPNDKSELSEGWHHAFLVAITDEATPPKWKMYEHSERMWRWGFAVWETERDILTKVPEYQSAPTSKKFSPGGQFQASKAYTWTKELIGRAIVPGEKINLDTMMPIPCRIKVTRFNSADVRTEYANILDLERWVEGARYLTPELREHLHTWMTMKLAKPLTMAAQGGPPAPRHPHHRPPRSANHPARPRL